MTRNARPGYSPQEVVDILKRTSLPTLITEGRDDYVVFRALEDKFSAIRLSVLPVGGRSCVLDVFERRDEIRHGSFGFIADRDLWVMSTIPDTFVSDVLVFSDGYSIENDVYRDANLEGLLSAAELRAFREELSEFLKWYSFAVKETLAGNDPGLNHHPNKVLSDGKICENFCAAIGFGGADDETFNCVFAEYAKLLRGKSLFELLVRHLSYRTRAIKHSKGSLLEYALAANGPILRQTYKKIEEIFA